MKKIELYPDKSDSGVMSVNSLSSLFNYILNIKEADNTILAFRGEKMDYGDTELYPSIYRSHYLLENEDKIFRESQRFNNQEFVEDRTTFDKLSRIQHYSAPTRLLDISEDLMSALYFATEKNDNDNDNDSILYIFEIDEKEIKYYDSDTVSVISNLAKIPLDNTNEKSKRKLLCDIIRFKEKKGKDKFNKQKSVKFLKHEIREEKPQFKPIIDPKHLISVQCVRPKLTSGRIKSQKGFFLLFGLNPNDITKPIKLIDKKNKLLDNTKIQHPIKQIHKIKLKTHKIKTELEKIGIKKSFIYPDIDKVSEYLKIKYKKQ